MSAWRKIGLCVKRAMDVVIAALVVVAAAPIIALAAMVVFVRMGRPVLFRQARPGLREKPFTLYKFRTMSTAWGSDGRLLPDGARLTALGRTLRRWSIDELPQLWNVLKGDMSLVGPRPLLMEYLERYTTIQRRRHEVRPGITGLAQVNGRNAITWEEKFAYDVRYVENWSVYLDIKIATATLRQVIVGRGVTPEGQTTTDYFTGTAMPKKSGDDGRPASC
jgi:sugar transferase EpsL